MVNNGFPFSASNWWKFGPRVPKSYLLCTVMICLARALSGCSVMDDRMDCLTAEVFNWLIQGGASRSSCLRCCCGYRLYVVCILVFGGEGVIMEGWKMGMSHLTRISTSWAFLGRLKSETGKESNQKGQGNTGPQKVGRCRNQRSTSTMVYGNMSQEKKPPYSRVTSRLVKYINFDHLKVNCCSHTPLILVNILT